MKKLLLSIIITLFFLSLTFTGCQTGKYPPAVTKVLKQAGTNRAELEKVLTTYAESVDSLKLQAAWFLLANMEGHKYTTFDLLDSAGAVIAFNVLDYPDYKTMTAYLDSLEKEKGELDFKKKDEVTDISSITGDFLIEHIDYAFQAWREKPWAQELSFEDFREYILPYRGSNEPLEAWRGYFYEKYAGIESQMQNPSNPLEAASLINDDIMSWFKFDPRYYCHPTDQGLSEMLENKLGRCEDMTNLTIFALRANGLAVTSDFTPYWANTGNNHAWNAIVLPSGEVIPFMGAEANPGKYKLANKLSKVYRKTFSRQANSLGAVKNDDKENLPPYLSKSSYKDVTQDYVDVCDVKVILEEEVPAEVDIAYLCVFNSGKWKAIQWAVIDGQNVVFQDMGMDIAYLPAYYIDKKIVPAGSPFILTKDSSIRKLTPDSSITATVKLFSTTKRKLVTSTDGIAKAFFKAGKEYELFYWDESDWQSLGVKTGAGKPLKFANVPADGLYWLLKKDSKREERIFTIADGKQVWW